MKNKLFLLFSLFAVALFSSTAIQLNLIKPINIDEYLGHSTKKIFLDRNGKQLNQNYIGEWNKRPLSLNQFDELIIKSVVMAEDKRFYDHFGVDVFAKLRAIGTNLKNLSLKQGGSTISEQVVRIRRKKSKKTLWNRWLELWLAIKLEADYSKDQILTFYLNQVPFAANRRGFEQGAFYYFGRHLETLTPKEIMGLTVMLRSPSAYDITRRNIIENRIKDLAFKLKITISDKKLIGLKGEDNFVNAKYFVNYAKKQLKYPQEITQTYLNPYLQKTAEQLLNKTLKKNNHLGALHGALLIVDHTNGEVLTYIVNNGQSKGIGIDTIQTPRQPASTIKPFLYAYYFEQGHLPYEKIEDTPHDLAFAGGVHQLKNYSRSYYGDITLREGLANSLNIPAIKIIQDIGVHDFYSFLEKTKLPLENNVLEYGEGLALGNAQVSLFNLTQAYTCLANRGDCQKLRLTPYEEKETFQVISKTSADLVRDILSDTHARRKEFGDYEFSHQVAVKTGTSTDYRDSWSFVFNDKYLIGTWIGNLDVIGMKEITGSKLALKIAKTLIQDESLDYKAMKFKVSKNLKRKQYCFKKDGKCEMREDLFPLNFQEVKVSKKISNDDFNIIPNQPYIHLALDPRVPKEMQIFKFTTTSKELVEWKINDTLLERGKKVLNFNLTKGLSTITAKNVNGEIQQIKVYVH